jgi:hypothetical protein
MMLKLPQIRNLFLLIPFLFTPVLFASTPGTSDLVATLAKIPGLSAQHVVSNKDFCRRLDQLFIQIATGHGVSAGESTLLASTALQKMISEFKDGRASDFVALRHLGSHFEQIQARSSEPLYLRPDKVLAPALGIEGEVSFILNASELRFMASLPEGQPILLAANHAATLTPARLQEAILMARQRNSPIHILWLGSDRNDDNVREAAPYFGLASQTRGSFLDLSSSELPCANQI